MPPMVTDRANCCELQLAAPSSSRDLPTHALPSPTSPLALISFGLTAFVSCALAASTDGAHEDPEALRVGSLSCGPCMRCLLSVPTSSLGGGAADDRVTGRSARATRGVLRLLDASLPPSHHSAPPPACHLSLPSSTSPHPTQPPPTTITTMSSMRLPEQFRAAQWTERNGQLQIQQTKLRQPEAEGASPLLSLTRALRGASRLTHALSPSPLGPLSQRPSSRCTCAVSTRRASSPLLLSALLSSPPLPRSDSEGGKS